MSVNESLFPHLVKNGGYRLTSKPNSRQNCIAHAANRPDEWWDPAEDQFWPDQAPRNYKIVSLIRVFELLGYSICQSDKHENGYEKVAIYGDDEEYIHAARQLEDGSWTSKLGPDDDINHPKLESLEGEHYGNVVKLLKRPRKG